MSDEHENPLGRGEAVHTPTNWQTRAQVQVSSCDKFVPPASENIIGQCIYYYRPVHQEYVNKSGVTTWEAMKAWLTAWNPWDDVEVARRLLQNRDALIRPPNESPLWSRGTNFMMRHIGCGHWMPNYYVVYGYYYCSNYGEKLKPHLTEKGRRWLRQARWNLQKNMELGLSQNMAGGTLTIPCKYNKNRGFSLPVPKFELELNGGELQKFAFRTHVPSYLDAGLADLDNEDLARIGGQPNIEEWGEKDTWKQAVVSGVEVLGKKTFGDDMPRLVRWTLDRLLEKFE